VREAFVTEGIGYDAALVSLELAILLAEEGRAAELRDLADEMLPIFQTQDVHREALAALTLFRQAAAREEASPDLVRRINHFLARARYDPELKLES
jgi:hypothetical protein